jgi:hypothetical protein
MANNLRHFKHFHAGGALILPVDVASAVDRKSQYV